MKNTSESTSSALGGEEGERAFAYPGIMPANVITTTTTTTAAAAAVDTPTFDAREFAEEVDLSTKKITTEFEGFAKQDKWSEQMKALQLVISAIGSTPKIKSGCDVAPILGAIKGFLRQGHVQVQVRACERDDR